MRIEYALTIWLVFCLLSNEIPMSQRMHLRKIQKKKRKTASLIETNSAITNNLVDKNFKSFVEQISNPDCKTGLTYSGYLKVDDEAPNALYFIFSGKNEVFQEDSLPEFPIIIWLNGGPGSTSQYGNFAEVGPCTLNKNFEAVPREISWTNFANILFVDQPIGTGGTILMDPKDIPTSELVIREHFYHALLEFYQLPFGKKFINTPLYIIGESYAGKYIPNIA